MEHIQNFNKNLNEKLSQTRIRLIITAAILALCVVLALLPDGRGQVSEQASDSEQETEAVQNIDGESQDQHTVIQADVEEAVVVLDPGHDTVHTGTKSDDGLAEETLNLKIANYCKEALEEYPGVEVYLTRTEEGCPFTGSYEPECLEGRVEYAESVGATVFVSLHVNWNSDPTISGTQIYVPNENYDATLSAESRELADLIMAQLNDLGLEYQKIYSRDSSERTYPDGSVGDYWSILYNCKLAGFPGVIVEHAFISCPDDLERFLTTEEGLRSLAEADARAIAEYLGLES